MEFSVSFYLFRPDFYVPKCRKAFQEEASGSELKNIKAIPRRQDSHAAPCLLRRGNAVAAAGIHLDENCEREYK